MIDESTVAVTLILIGLISIKALRSRYNKPTKTQ